MKVSATMPPITVVPIIWRGIAPAPDAIHSARTDNKRERGHHEGPEPKPRSVQGGVDQRPAAFVLLFGDATIRIEFLAPDR